VNEPVLEIRDLAVVFDGFRALDGVNLTIDEGELRFLIGPNGAGKTTLIDAITGLVKPTAGEVRFHGRALLDVRDVAQRLQVGRPLVGTVLETDELHHATALARNRGAHSRFATGGSFIHVRFAGAMGRSALGITELHCARLQAEIFSNNVRQPLRCAR